MQPNRHIRTVAEDVVLLNDHIAEVDPDAEVDPLIGRQRRISLNHSPLDLRRASHGVHNARIFRQQAVARVLYDPAPVLLDLRIDQLLEVRLEPFVGLFLGRPHQARIAGHVGGEDRGEAANGSHLSVASLLA